MGIKIDKEILMSGDIEIKKERKILTTWDFSFLKDLVIEKVLLSKKYLLVTKTITTLFILCSYHVTYVFQRKFTLYSCLNVRELLSRNRRKIWSIS